VTRSNRAFLGEFEQRVLLAILRSGAEPRPVEIRRELAHASNQAISRGAFYTTLDRLEAKQLIAWTTVAGTDARDGLPDRHCQVTSAGIEALKASRKTLLQLWNGLEWLLNDQ
jgi:PadR family transcriptional regulator, regulatory protein PadR